MKFKQTNTYREREREKKINERKAFTQYLLPLNVQAEIQNILLQRRKEMQKETRRMNKKNWIVECEYTEPLAYSKGFFPVKHIYLCAQKSARPPLSSVATRDQIFGADRFQQNRAAAGMIHFYLFARFHSVAILFNSVLLRL